jgi:hypothetical protein
MLRFPLWAMNKRPRFVAKDEKRQAHDQKPEKPSGDLPRAGGES